MADLEQKRKKRQKQTAEVFTPPSLVNDMLNKLPKSVWFKNKTFCDPACGNGNFLIWILLRKIAKGHKPLEALKTVYGADIMRDNIQECRLRLLKVISLFEKVTEEHIKAIFWNIVWINMHRHPGGSLDYDFSFKNRPKIANVKQWMGYIYEENKLDEVDLPIDEEKFTPKGCVDLFADFPE
jgi:hypothetical protein